MARPDKRARKQKQARDKIDKALARGHAVDAANALLDLSADQRQVAIPAVVAAMQHELERCDQAPPAWLSCIEREPRLLEQLDRSALLARWKLFVAALKLERWTALDALWEQLQTALPPDLASAVGELVHSRGQVTLAASELVQRLDGEAERLGYDRRRERIKHTAPQRADQVERACLLCFDTEPWPRFQQTVSGWLRRAPPHVAEPLRVLAAQLSERELLTRSRDGSRSALEVARFIAGSNQAASAPAELEGSLGLCLKVATATCAATDLGDKDFAALAIVARAAAHYPSLSGLIAPLLFSTPLYRCARANLLRLLRVTLEADGSAATLVRVAVEYHAHPAEEHATADVPPWLTAAIEAAGAQPAALAQALSQAREELEQRWKDNVCAEPVHALLELASVEQAVVLIEQLWDHADEPLRQALADHNELLIERMSEHDGVADIALLQGLLGDLDPELEALPRRLLQKFLRSKTGQDALDDLHDELGEPRIRDDMEPWFWRLCARTAPYNVETFDEALAREPKGRRRRALVQAFLDRRSTLSARVAALLDALQAECYGAVSELHQRLLDGVTPTLADAVRALSGLHEMGASPVLRRRVAQEVLRCAEREPEHAARPEVQPALSLARKLARPPKSRTGKRRKSRTTKGKSRTKRTAQPQQAQLAFEPEGSARG